MSTRFFDKPVQQTRPQTRPQTRQPTAQQSGGYVNVAFASAVTVYVQIMRDAIDKARKYLANPSKTFAYVNVNPFLLVEVDLFNADGSPVVDKDGNQRKKVYPLHVLHYGPFERYDEQTTLRDMFLDPAMRDLTIWKRLGFTNGRDGDGAPVFRDLQTECIQSGLYLTDHSWVDFEKESNWFTWKVTLSTVPPQPREDGSLRAGPYGYGLIPNLRRPPTQYTARAQVRPRVRKDAPAVPDSGLAPPPTTVAPTWTATQQDDDQQGDDQ